MGAERDQRRAVRENRREKERGGGGGREVDGFPIKTSSKIMHHRICIAPFPYSAMLSFTVILSYPLFQSLLDYHVRGGG